MYIFTLSPHHIFSIPISGHGEQVLGRVRAGPEPRPGQPDGRIPDEDEHQETHQDLPHPLPGRAGQQGRAELDRGGREAHHGHDRGGRHTRQDLAEGRYVWGHLRWLIKNSW